jgi:hypothetical protein
LAVCLNISTVINIKILAISNQQIQSYKFTRHISAFLSVVLITEMLEICIQTSYDQNVPLILKSYLPVVYGTTLRLCIRRVIFFLFHWWHPSYIVWTTRTKFVLCRKQDRQNTTKLNTVHNARQTPVSNKANETGYFPPLAN